MKISICQYFMLLLLSNVALSQKNGVVSGQIQSNAKESVAYAAVSIYDTSSQLVSGTITDDKGKFKLSELPYGVLAIEVEYLGYEKLTQQIEIDADQTHVSMGIIELQLSNTQLDGVTVTAERSSYTAQLDKKVFNVGRDQISKGGSALDVLDQVPQVTVQPTGAIELRGSTAVQILINGRRSGLTLDNALEQLAVETIDRIEVITNPSARFDASGSAGIINIILKKNKGEGLKGQISTYVGTPANHMLLPSLSYKGERLELFGNYRWRYSDYNGRYIANQTFKNTAQDFINKNETESRHDDGRSLYIGGDYRTSDRSNLTVAYYRADTKDTDSTFLDYMLSKDKLEYNLDRTGNSVEQRDYNQLEGSFVQNFKKEGMKWQTDFQYDFWNSLKNWHLDATGSISALDVPAQLRTTNRSESDDVVINTDLDLPLQTGQLRVGAKWEARDIKNNYIAESEQGGSWMIFNELANNVDYKEQISALYAEYKGSINKLQYNIGLRGENSIIKLGDESGELNSRKAYFNVFPSAFVSYPISKAVEMQVSASRRINRPSLWSLYPFFELTDINILQVGNLDLNPSYTNAFEASFSFVNELVSINPGVYYRATSSPDETYVYQDANGYTIFQPVNIDGINEFGAELSARIRATKFLSIDADLNYLSFDQKGSYKDQDMSVSGSAFRMRTGANLRLPKATRISIRYQYRGPRPNAIVNYKASTDLSMSISKSFFDNKLNLSLQGRNLLDTNDREANTETELSSIYQKSRRYGPRYMLGVTYRFNMTQRDRVRQENRGNR